MRYVNLKNLPKRIDSLGREIIDWENCYGEKCYFEFDTIKGYIEIINTFKNGKHTYVEFKINNKKYVMRVDVDYPNYDRFNFIKTSIMSSPFPSIYNIYNINFNEAHKFACYTNKTNI